jgi:hypothetical protein
MPITDPTYSSPSCQLLNAISGGRRRRDRNSGSIRPKYGGRLAERGENSAKAPRKLEALVKAAYELDVWFKREENWILSKGPQNLEPSPLATIQTAATLHFSNLVPQAEALSSAVTQYRSWLMTGRSEMTAKNLPTVSQEHLGTMSTVYEPFLTARRELIARAKSEMAVVNAA